LSQLSISRRGTLEAAGLPEPMAVNAMAQKPIEGVSMLYSFNDTKAAERRRETQDPADAVVFVAFSTGNRNCTHGGR
jgi:hypothetical protein